MSSAPPLPTFSAFSNVLDLVAHSPTVQHRGRIDTDHWCVSEEGVWAGKNGPLPLFSILGQRADLHVHPVHIEEAGFCRSACRLYLDDPVAQETVACIDIALDCEGLALLMETAPTDANALHQFFCARAVGRALDLSGWINSHWRQWQQAALRDAHPHLDALALSPDAWL